MPPGAFVKEEQVAPPMPPGAFVKEEGVVPPMPPDAIVTRSSSRRRSARRRSARSNAAQVSKWRSAAHIRCTRPPVSSERRREREIPTPYLLSSYRRAGMSLLKYIQAIYIYLSYGLPTRGGLISVWPCASEKSESTLREADVLATPCRCTTPGCAGRGIAPGGGVIYGSVCSLARRWEGCLLGVCVGDVYRSTSTPRVAPLAHYCYGTGSSGAASGSSPGPLRGAGLPTHRGTVLRRCVSAAAPPGPPG